MRADSTVTIEFKGRHDNITERMQAHAAKKLARLAHYQDRLLRIEVVADHAHSNPEVELIAHQRRGAPVVAKGRGATFAATIDLLVAKLDAQLRKQKEKRKDHKVPNGKQVRSAAAPRGRGRKAAAEDTDDELPRKSVGG
jgi:putative sigma-54 modulation protein